MENYLKVPKRLIPEEKSLNKKDIKKLALS